MPPKPAFTERTIPKQQGSTTDSAMPPLPTNVAHTDRSTADRRRPPLPTGPHSDTRGPPLPSGPRTDAVRSPIPTTTDQRLRPTDTSPKPDMKTPSMGGK